jgi:hypothetical protein
MEEVNSFQEFVEFPDMAEVNSFQEFVEFPDMAEVNSGIRRIS